MKKLIIILCFLFSACITSNRIRGLRTDRPPDNCQYSYTRMLQNVAMGCWCSTIGTTDDNKPVILVMEVDENICLKKALEPN